jgi:hypothetical protein
MCSSARPGGGFVFGGDLVSLVSVVRGTIGAATFLHVFTVT